MVTALTGTDTEVAEERIVNGGPVRIQYKCLVSIYVLLVMKLLFSKQNYNVPTLISL